MVINNFVASNKLPSNAKRVHKVTSIFISLIASSFLRVGDTYHAVSNSIGYSFTEIWFDCTFYVCPSISAKWIAVVRFDVLFNP